MDQLVADLISRMGLALPVAILVAVRAGQMIHQIHSINMEPKITDLAIDVVKENIVKQLEILLRVYKDTTAPITSFSLFLFYIVITPLMLGFEKDFLSHFHLGLIWISLLFSFLSVPFFRNEKEDGTLELFYLSVYCLPKILLLQLVGYWVIQISFVFCCFHMLQFPYKFGRSVIDWLNISLGSLVLTLLCGIHSCLALVITSSSGWNSLKNLTTLPTLLPLTFYCTSIETEWFHVLLLIGYFFLFLSLFKILVSISCKD